MSNQTTPAEQVFEAKDFLLPLLGDRKPTSGLVLGSGLGGFAETLTDPVSIPYDEIPHFPVSGVAGHEGKLWCGTIKGNCVLIMQGRVHAYEDWSLHKVVLGVRTMAALGAQSFVITNAAGGIRHKPKDLVIITDHMNLMGFDLNPLRGDNDIRLGPRFPDMSRAYSLRLREHARRCMKTLGMVPKLGVYAVIGGPSYETPAEVEVVKRLGGDLLGMSTIPEVIALNHMGKECMGISCVTNYAAGISPTPLSHDEVKEVADHVRPTLTKLLTKIITTPVPVST